MSGFQTLSVNLQDLYRIIQDIPAYAKLHQPKNLIERYEQQLHHLQKYDSRLSWTFIIEWFKYVGITNVKHGWRYLPPCVYVQYADTSHPASLMTQMRQVDNKGRILKNVTCMYDYYKNRYDLASGIYTVRIYDSEMRNTDWYGRCIAKNDTRIYDGSQAIESNGDTPVPLTFNLVIDENSDISVNEILKLPELKEWFDSISEYPNRYHDSFLSEKMQNLISGEGHEHMGMLTCGSRFRDVENGRVDIAYVNDRITFKFETDNVQAEQIGIYPLVEKLIELGAEVC